MRKFIVSNLLVLMFLVGAASGFSLSSVAWWGLRSGQHDLDLLHRAGPDSLRAQVHGAALARNADARATLLGLSLLSTLLFCATAWLSWRQSVSARDNAARLGRDHTLFKSLFNATGDAIFLFSQDRVIDCNQAAMALFGEPGAITCPALGPAQPPCQPDGRASAPAWAAQLAQQAGARAGARFEWNFVSAGGAEFTAEVSVTSASLGAQTILQLIVRDISERKQAEQSMLLANQAFESSLEGIAITDAACNILSVNRAFTTITGYTLDQVRGRNPSMLSSGRHCAEFYRELWCGLEESREWHGEIWNKRRNGEVYPQWLTISRVCDAHGRTTNYVGVFSDISELKAAHARNLHSVYHDQLTALPNGVLLADRLQQLSGQAGTGPGQHIGLMYLDVDRLKVVNDSMGREAGDRLLQLVAARLQGHIRSNDTLARLNGDEFAVLLCKIDGAADASSVARHILAGFDEPFELNGQLIHVSLSIGISVYPADGTDCDALLQNAAMAMYRAKQRGGVSYELYDRELGARAAQRLAIETGLRHALERGELEVFYQPQFACHSGGLIGFEALLRWRHPELGLIPPATFLAIAEETGAIVPIGAHVLQMACAQAEAWRRASSGHFLMAVNLSARQLRHPDFVEHVIAALRTSGLPAARLELEITESMMMHDLDACVDIMNRLSALGVQFSIDDFGTGYSSLSYLKKMPIKALKIDRSFIRDIVTDADGASIVGAIVAMSNTLGLRVVAEGIEDAAQLAHLKGYTDIIGQGYLLGRPASAQATTRMIEQLEARQAPAETAA